MNYVVRFSVGPRVVQVQDGESAPATFEVGEAVKVLYLEDQPHDSAQVDRGIWIWARAALLAVAGVLATAFSLKSLHRRVAEKH